MPYDKRQPYETDIRVPLMMRGPGIVRGTEVKSAVSSVDLFPTILEIAGVERPSDGMSLLDDKVTDRTVLVEYHGERSHRKPDSGCSTDADPNLTVSNEIFSSFFRWFRVWIFAYFLCVLQLCHKDFACKCQDSANNTYTCVRRVAEKFNNVFCVFEDDEVCIYIDVTLKCGLSIFLQSNVFFTALCWILRHRERSVSIGKFGTQHGWWTALQV